MFLLCLNHSRRTKKIVIGIHLFSQTGSSHANNVIFPSLHSNNINVTITIRLLLIIIHAETSRLSDALWMKYKVFGTRKLSLSLRH